MQWTIILLWVFLPLQALFLWAIVESLDTIADLLRHMRNDIQELKND